MRLSRHPSVLALLAADGTTADPVVAIRRRARALVEEIRTQFGFEGPPFDARTLASVRGFKVTYTAEGFGKDQDACIGPGFIAVNSTKPAVRQRYSVAHEVIHTLFPDYEDELRRAGVLWRGENDDSDVERLCQIGAAELVMPAFAFAPTLERLGLSLSTILSLRAEYDVSLEASARRVADLTQRKAMVLFLRPILGGLPNKPVFAPLRAGEYWPHRPLGVSVACPSEAWPDVALSAGTVVPKDSVAAKAWKRAGYPRLAAPRYASNEAWPILPNGTICQCEAMVLPPGSTAPNEVLCLLQLP
jgi:hypothetical protein